MARFTNRRNVVTEIGFMRMDEGATLKEAQAECKRLMRKPQEEVKALFSELAIRRAERAKEAAVNG